MRNIHRESHARSAMTELVVKLPDELAQRAKRAGLLSDDAIQQLLEDAIRHQAGKRAARCGGSGPCGRLIQAATDGNVTLYPSPALLAEPRAVLGRAHLAVSLRRQNASVDEAMTPYGVLAINVSPTALPRVVAADADDDQVVAAAVAAKAI